MRLSAAVDGRPLLRRAIGGGRLELARRLLALDRVGAGLGQLEGPAEVRERVAAATGQVQVFLGPAHLLLGALQLGLRDEALGEERLQVGEGALGLLEVALGVADRGRGLVLLEPALALLDVAQLEVAPLHLEPGGGQLLVVLDLLEVHVLPRLHEVGLGLRQKGLVAADLLLEGRRVEEDEQVVLLHELALRGQGHDLGLVALDGRGVGHGAEGLEGAGLGDRDLERPFLDPGGGDALRGIAAGERERQPEGQRPRPPRRRRRSGAGGDAPPRPGPARLSRVQASRRSQGRAGLRRAGVHLQERSAHRQERAGLAAQAPEGAPNRSGGRPVRRP